MRQSSHQLEELPPLMGATKEQWSSTRGAKEAVKHRCAYEAELAWVKSVCELLSFNLRVVDTDHWRRLSSWCRSAWVQPIVLFC